jgi:precorrin-6B methylase 2
MPWWHATVESRHELQNPTSADKILLLGERLGLGPGAQVLDVGAGRGGPAILLAREYGCRLTCVERAEEFAEAARRRVRAAGVDHLVEIVHADAGEVPLEPHRYDAALCLGASFVWGGLGQTLATLTPSVRAGGCIAVGEPYWRTWPLPGDLDPGPEYSGFVPLADTADRVESAGLNLVTLIASSEDDWDRYESLHWLTLDEWLREHPDDPDAQGFREDGARFRREYLSWGRRLLGWAIFVGRRP